MPTLLGIQTRLWSFIGRKPALICYANGGLGDELMLTAIARAARATGRPLHILTERREVWRGNSDPLSLQTGIERWWYAKRRGWLRTEIVHLAYETTAPSHIAVQMAARAGVELSPDWRPVFRLDNSPSIVSRRVVVQNSCRGAKYAADTKEWSPTRWVALAERLAPDFELVQLGTPSDPPLPHARDLRGRTDLREAATVIGGAACFVGLESGLMHVAAAVGTPAVIIYGGRSRPASTGYRWHAHVTREPPCVECGLNFCCPHELVCLDIPVDEVELCVRRTLRSESSVIPKNP